MEKGLHEYYSMEAQNLEFFSESSKLNLDLFQRAEITLTSSISMSTTTWKPKNLIFLKFEIKFWLQLKSTLASWLMSVLHL